MGGIWGLHSVALRQKNCKICDLALKRRDKKSEPSTYIPSYKKLLQWAARVLLCMDDKLVLLNSNKPTAFSLLQKKKNVKLLYNDNILNSMHYTYTT